MKTTPSFFACAIIACLFASAGFAAEEIWTGATDTDINTATNWSADGLNASDADDAKLQGAADGELLSLSAALTSGEVASLEIGDSIGTAMAVTLELAGFDFAMSGGLTLFDNAILEIESATPATLTVNALSLGSDAELYVGANVTLIINGDVTEDGATMQGEADSIIRFAGASIAWSNAFDISIDHAVFAQSGSATVTMLTGGDFVGDIEILDGASVTFDQGITTSGNLTIGEAATGASGEGTISAPDACSFGGSVTLHPGAQADFGGGASDGAEFDGDLVLGEGATLTVSGNSTLSGNASIAADALLTITPLLELNDGASISLAADSRAIIGTLHVLENATIEGADVAGGVETSIAVDALQLGVALSANAAALTLSNTGAMSDPLPLLDITGDLTYLANGSSIADDGSPWQIYFGANIQVDASDASADLGPSTTYFHATHLITGSGSFDFNNAINFGAADLQGSLTISDGFANGNELLSFQSLALASSSTLAAGDNRIGVVASLSGASGNTWTQSAGGALVLLGTLMEPTQLTGILLPSADVEVAEGSGAIAGDGTTETRITIGGNLSVIDDSTPGSSRFAAFSDSTAGNASAVITIAGDLSVGADARLALGEGSWSIGGTSIDLSAGDTLVEIDGSAGSAPSVNLTNTGQVALSFSTNGSAFLVSSVMGTTRVRHTGRMMLAGPLNLSASASGFAWDGSLDTMTSEFGALQLGLASISNASSSGASPYIITIDEGDVALEEVEAISFDDGSTQDAWIASRFLRTDANSSSSSAGRFLFGTLHLDGDATSAAAGDDDNAPLVEFVNAEAQFSGAVTIDEGMGDDAGATLRFRSTTARFTAGINVGGNASATSNANGATLETFNASTLTFQLSTTLQVASFCTLDIDGSDAGGSASTVMITNDTASAPYAIDVAGNAASVTLASVNVSALGSGDLSITLASGSLSMSNASFSDYGMSGVSIRPGTILTSFRDCRFTDGQSGGAHVTLESGGLGNSAAQVLNADGNQFDLSVMLLIACDDADSNYLNMRGGSLGFGISGVTISAGDAESMYDGDGEDADDVRWGIAPILTLANLQAGGLDAPVSVTAGGGARRAGFLFTLGASGGQASAVSSLTVTVTPSLTAGSVLTGTVTPIVLFRDGGNGVYDAGDTTLGTYTGSVLPAEITFLVSPTQSIALGLTQTWGIALQTADGTTGTIAFNIASGGVGTTESVVEGLALNHTVQVLYPIPVIEAGASPTALPDTARAEAGGFDVALAFNVRNTSDASNGGFLGVITGVTLELNAEWLDFRAFDDPGATITRISAWADGAANLPGSGDGRFTANSADTLLGRATGISITGGTGSGTQGSQTISVTILFAQAAGESNLEVQPGGDERTIYFTIRFADGEAITAARRERLRVRLSLDDTDDLMISRAGSSVTALTAPIRGVVLSFQRPQGTDGDGCALSANGSNTAVWMLALLAGCLLIALRRNELEGERS